MFSKGKDDDDPLADTRPLYACELRVRMTRATFAALRAESNRTGNAISHVARRILEKWEREPRDTG